MGEPYHNATRRARVSNVPRGTEDKMQDASGGPYTGLSHETLIGKLAFSLTRAGYYLATAESCTGGLIAAMCTDIAGSSDWFKGGIVAYANELKENLLNVPPSAIEEHGAVSAQVVRQMALGALSRCRAQASIAVSGVAGPGGGTPDKPVGTVWIAVAVVESPGICTFDHAELARNFPGCSKVRAVGQDVAVQAMRHHFGGTRSDVRRRTAEKGLRDLAVLLEENTIG